MLLDEVAVVTVTFDLPPDLEALLLAEARAKGISLEEVVKAHLYGGSACYTTQPRTAADLDRALDEAASLIPKDVPPIPDSALSREDIYSRENHW